MITNLADTFTPAEIEHFKANGYLIVRALASGADCAVLRAVAQHHLDAAIAPVEHEADTKYPGAPPSLDAPGGKTVRRLLQAYARDPLFARWATHPAIAARLRQLLGSCVELSQTHHNCVMTKDPGFSTATGWHQDIRYWSFRRPELISVWTALGQEFEENGCLQVLPGTHAMQFQPARLDPALFLRPDTGENQALINSRLNVELDPGDVLFFHCRLLHAASSNRTTATKFSLVYTYHADDNPPQAGTRSASLPDIALG